MSDTRKPILFAWLLAGTLDISAAILYYGFANGVPATSLLRGIASGVMGPDAFAGGLATAALGLALHYLIALIWTLVLFGVFRTFRALAAHPVPIGVLYGLFVWAAMNLIVLPSSRVHHRPLQLGPSVAAAVLLIACIGLPMAFVLGRHLRQGPEA